MNQIEKIATRQVKKKLSDCIKSINIDAGPDLLQYLAGNKEISEEEANILCEKMIEDSENMLNNLIEVKALLEACLESK